MEKIIYLYRYLPEHIKPWASDCLETLNDLTKVKIYKVNNYSYEFTRNDIEFSTFVLYDEYSLIGVCHSILFNTDNIDDLKNIIPINEGSNQIYITCVNTKKYAFSLIHSYINDNKRPYNKTFLSKCNTILNRIKLYSEHKDFIESTKEDYFFEEDN